MAYLKPQSPIKYNEDHIYPLTTVDQIIMDDGNRLSGVGVYLEKPEESDDTTTTETIDADTLGGILPSDFVLDSELDTYKTEVSNSYLSKTGTAANSTKFNNYTFDALKSYMLDLAHPIGSYYWSSNSTNPSSLFGGTWEQITDKFVLAAGSSYSVGATGGAATVTLTANQMPSHTHTFTGTAASHTHNCQIYTNNNTNFTMATAGVRLSNPSWVNAGEKTAGSTGGDNCGVTESRSITPAGTNSNTGGGAAHNNMPPYIVAYCWRRTA